jgi:NAD(P)-dependent dehydrogenase (short-subunit alcohol dehydrogenase family)
VRCRLLGSLRALSVRLSGGARGIGNALARAFAESGSNAIAILDLDQAQCDRAAADMANWMVEQGVCEACGIRRTDAEQVWWSHKSSRPSALRAM